jgi:membrane-bound serine protease (ClpP class)
MIGQAGVTRSPLSPSGTIVVQGEIWNAFSLTPIAAGEPIIVRGVDGLNLLVEPVPQSASKREPALQR